jgi:DNA-binding transcriptional MocR family regulator
MDDHTSSKLLYEQLADRLAGLIEKSTYRPGERIPSIREMSRQQSTSISTVIMAYQLLEDRDLIESRPQSGYYVRPFNTGRLPEPEISAPGLDPCQVSLNQLVMMVLNDTRNPNLVKLGAALPNIELLPIEKINHIIASLARRWDNSTHQYQFLPGLERLRTQIARRAATYGCALSPNDIIITSGGTEALGLCLRAACRPGDIVAIETPMYFGTLQTMEVLGARVLEIPTHPRDGISLGALQFAIEHNPVRAVLVISNFNNPLGSCIPDERKKDLVELLGRHDIPLIENDVSGEIYFSDKRPSVAKAFDNKGLVMLCSSFSKDISPDLRVGWAAPGRYRDQVEWLKFTNTVSTSTLAQMAVTEFLESGNYDRHLRRIRREYARNVTLMSQAVMRYFPPETRVTRPTGGFVMWVQLPETVDSLELYKLALKGGIALAPGQLFSPTYQFPNFIRLNAAEWTYSTERALEQLGEMVTELMQPPANQ